MEIENRQIVEKISNSKSSFFKKMDKIYILVRLAKKKRDDTNYQCQEQIKNISEPAHIKMIVWNCY